MWADRGLLDGCGMEWSSLWSVCGEQVAARPVGGKRMARETEKTRKDIQNTNACYWVERIGKGCSWRQRRRAVGTCRWDWEPFPEEKKSN